MILFLLLILVFILCSFKEKYEVYSADYHDDLTDYKPECKYNSDCDDDQVCINYYGLRKCKSKLKEGDKCTVSNSLGFTYMPCDNNLSCILDYTGSPEVDVESYGTCQKSDRQNTHIQKHISYPYKYPLPYTYPYPIYLDTLLKPNQWFRY